MSRSSNCSLLLSILKEDPKPILLDFTYLTKNVNHMKPTPLQDQIFNQNVSNLHANDSILSHYTTVGKKRKLQVNYNCKFFLEFSFKLTKFQQQKIISS